MKNRIFNLIFLYHCFFMRYNKNSAKFSFLVTLKLFYFFIIAILLRRRLTKAIKIIQECQLMLTIFLSVMKETYLGSS